MSTLRKLREIDFSTITKGASTLEASDRFPLSVIQIMFERGTQKGIVFALMADCSFWDVLCNQVDGFQWATTVSTMKFPSVNSKRRKLKFSPFVLEAKVTKDSSSWNLSLLSQDDRKAWDKIVSLNEDTGMYCQFWLSVAMENVKRWIKSEISDEDIEFLASSFEDLISYLYEHDLLMIVQDQLQIKPLDAFSSNDLTVVEEYFRILWTASLSVSEEVMSRVYPKETSQN